MTSLTLYLIPAPSRTVTCIVNMMHAEVLSTVIWYHASCSNRWYDVMLPVVTFTGNVICAEVVFTVVWCGTPCKTCTWNLIYTDLVSTVVVVLCSLYSSNL